MYLIGHGAQDKEMPVPKRHSKDTGCCKKSLKRAKGRYFVDLTPKVVSDLPHPTLA